MAIQQLVDIVRCLIKSAVSNIMFCHSVSDTTYALLGGALVHYDDLQVTRVGIDVIDSSYIQVSIIIAVIQLLCIMLSTLLCREMLPCSSMQMTQKQVSKLFCPLALAVCDVSIGSCFGIG